MTGSVESAEVKRRMVTVKSHDLLRGERHANEISNNKNRNMSQNRIEIRTSTELVAQ